MLLEDEKRTSLLASTTMEKTGKPEVDPSNDPESS
jgi:hypothetical protein